MQVRSTINYTNLMVDWLVTPVCFPGVNYPLHLVMFILKKNSHNRSASSWKQMLFSCDFAEEIKLFFIYCKA